MMECGTAARHIVRLACDGDGTTGRGSRSDEGRYSEGNPGRWWGRDVPGGNRQRDTMQPGRQITEDGEGPVNIQLPGV